MASGPMMASGPKNDGYKEREAITGMRRSVVEGTRAEGAGSALLLLRPAYQLLSVSSLHSTTPVF